MNGLRRDKKTSKSKQEFRKNIKKWIQLNECEEELKCARNELAESQRLTAESEAKAEAERSKNSLLEKQIEKLEETEKEKIEILNHNLSEAKNVA